MPRFRFSEEVFIDRPLDQVRAFLADVNNLVVWDRSVSKVVCASPAKLEPGLRFATIGPFRRGREGKRSEYEVIAASDSDGKVALVNSTVFKSAVWATHLAALGNGTLATWEMEMSTDLLHAPVALLLKLNSGAMTTDMQFLKRAIENGEVAKR